MGQEGGGIPSHRGKYATCCTETRSSRLPFEKCASPRELDPPPSGILYKATLTSRLCVLL